MKIHILGRNALNCALYLEFNVKYGIIDTFIVSLILTIVFEIFASPLANLFGLTGETTTEIIVICTSALRIASIGYIFMGFSVTVQGVLQSLGYAIKPLIISLLRLVIFVFPIAYLFTLSDNVSDVVWWTFPIAEILTAIISMFILKQSYKEKVEIISIVKVAKTTEKLVISISREHGTNGKEIARKVAEELEIKFYDKEEMKKYAVSHSLIENSNDDGDLYRYYLSLDAERDAIIKQAEIIKLIAKDSDCVIVGRASDYILRDDKNLIKIFLYAPLEYRINKIKEIYNDNYQEAKKHVNKSDNSRASYYEVISNQSWGNVKNYDLCLNCEIGNDKIVKIICDYIKNRNS